MWQEFLSPRGVGERFSDPAVTREVLKGLATLQDGRLDGQGRAPARDEPQWLADPSAVNCGANFDTDLPLRYLYPTVEGGIQAEWDIRDWSVTLEIDLDAQRGEYQALNLRDQACTEVHLSLADSGGWSPLNQALLRLGSPLAGASQSEVSDSLVPADPSAVSSRTTGPTDHA
jgi:hypothetical protein